MNKRLLSTKKNVKTIILIDKEKRDTILTMSAIEYKTTLSHEHHFVLQEKRIADELFNYLMDEYNSDLTTLKSARDRIHAAKQIGRYATKKSHIQALINSYKTDKNPIVRATAKECIENVISRKY